MKLSDLKYSYPEELIATFPLRPSRVMWVSGKNPPEEISLQKLLDLIPPGDILILNNTKVLKRRVFTDQNIEVLFLDKIEQKKLSNKWKVLFIVKKMALGDTLNLPNGFKMTLLEKGRPQIVEVFPALSDTELDQFAELPLPPYIQRARAERHNRAADKSWYQTAWASVDGSMAAPTASLHFNNEDIQYFKKKGVQVIELTLHVGLGTFLPVVVEDLNQHQMHSEQYEISEKSWQIILDAKARDKKIWALGTTTTRVVESVAKTGLLFGSTDILLQEGSEFNIIDRLLTNFHQPESTLLALVAGFSGLEKVKQCYHWAIEKKFRLFSYGDLSVWIK